MTVSSANSHSDAGQPANWLDTWHVNPSSNVDFRMIDGLRGLAILMVMACHLFYVNPLSGRMTLFLEGIASAGQFGVPVFFSISGFVIALPFWHRKVAGSGQTVPPGYARRRFWKIYPPLATTILLYTPIYYWLSGDRAFWTLALQWLSGLAFLAPVSGKLNPVMWTLVVEVQFYITLPLLLLALRRIAVTTSLSIITAILLLVPNLVRWMIYHGAGPAYSPFVDSRYPTGLDFFAFGVLMAGLQALRMIRKDWARLGNLGLGVLFIITLLAAWRNMYPLNSTWMEIFRVGVILASGLMLCYVADARHPVSQGLSAGWLRWFGIISYELYLLHQPIILWLRRVVGPCHGEPVKYISLLGSSFILSVFLAAILYRLVSLPLLKRGRARSA